MFKLDLEKAEKPEIKLPTSAGLSKKQESSRKTFISAFIDYAKAFVCVDHNKLWKILKEMSTDDQESALKYVVSDSKNPQTLFCGTPPTTVSSGTVFTKYRERTLQGQTENGAWAEWSVQDESDVHDRELWYETNPSLGTILTERKINDEITSDLVDFNIQRLG